MSLLGRPKNALPTPAATADNPLSEASERFGKSYFTAPDTGSAYHTTNYLETALLSRTYFEMAELIATCFKPTRMLEVGCAAGPTVFHLNSHFDTEAYGVDVSKWAVENAFHANVSQAPANRLPFPDGHFDVVFSCHVLENLTAPIIDESIAELSRVCAPGGIQYHLLPILGSGPYTDVFGSIVGLRKDITHSLLYPRAWWVDRWAKAGWHDSGVQAGHVYDNHGFEFSECQLILTRDSLSVDVAVRLARWNLDIARAYQNALVRRPRPGLEVFLNEIRDNWK